MSPPSTLPQRGEIWYFDFDPVRGHEQAGRRPALVLSVDAFNKSSAELVIVLPITSKAKGLRSHVAIAPPEGGLSLPSFIKCEDIRSVSTDRIIRRSGRASPETLSEVEDRTQILLGL